MPVRRPDPVTTQPSEAATEQAIRVFLQGNGLPGRWAGCSRFVILELGFGLGHKFLATWQAWRQDAMRCERLHVVAVDSDPPTADALGHAHAESPRPDLAQALIEAWPPLTPNLHLLDFEGGRVRLTLALGDTQALLPKLRLAADAIFLNSTAPANHPPVWTAQLLKSVGRLAAPGATASSASLAPELHAGLKTAGFEVHTSPKGSADDSRQATTFARWSPRFVPRRLPDPAVASCDAVVVGAGLAGAAAAQALARLGLRVTVLEREAAPAQGASGNPGGLFHGTVHADDGPHARLYRAAALAAAVEYRRALTVGDHADGVAGQVAGLLRLAAQEQGQPGLQRVLDDLGLPPDHVQLLDAEAASVLAGVQLHGPCWHYPAGGWMSPPMWVDGALKTPGVALRTGTAVQTLSRVGTDWLLQDARGQELARSPLVVLCNAAQAQHLLQPLGAAPWPLTQSRGQVTQVQYRPPAGSASLRLPVAGDGYALPLPGSILCGATRQEGDDDSTLRESDHRVNLARLQRLTGLVIAGEPSDWQGRVGWRLHSDDRLPVAGALPAFNLPPGQRRDQARLLPREAGLFVLTALGARGLTLAPLMGRLVAAQATGTPWPLEQDLVDAVDPGRWIVRAARRASLQPG